MDQTTEYNWDNNYTQGKRSRVFDCSGDSSAKQNVTFKNTSLINSNGIHSLFDTDSTFIDNENSVTLFNVEFDLSTAFCEQEKMIFLTARKQLLQLDQASKHNSRLKTPVNIDDLDFFEIRKQITDVLYHARRYIKRIGKPESGVIEKMNSFRRSLKHFLDLPDYVTSHSASQYGNMCVQPTYHLFHGHLEWRWHHLLLVSDIFQYQSQNYNSDFNSSGTFNNIDDNNMEKSTELDFEHYVSCMISDLIIIAIGRFEKIHINDALNTTPYSCSCVKECWLLLQLLIEKLNSVGKFKSFWTYFNVIFNKISQPQQQTTTSINVLSLPEIYKCSNVVGFSIWLISHIAQLQGCDENGVFIGSSNDRVQSNYTQLDLLIKNCAAIDAAVDETHLRVYIQLISDILTSWWEPKTDIIAMLWEYFHKRINSAFFIQGATPDTMAVSSKSALGLLEQIKQRVLTDTIQPSETSFNQFLRLIGKHFIRMQQMNNKTHWQKLKGRIYPKFGLNKLLALSEMGVLNFVSLFLTLVVSVDVNEIGSKLQELLNMFSPDKLESSRKSIIVKAHLAIIILYVENKIDVGGSVKNLIQHINTLLSNKDKQDGSSNIMRTFIEGFQDVIDTCQDFQLSEHTIIDSWIGRYFSMSSTNDQSRLLQIFVSIMSKLQILYKHYETIDAKYKDSQTCSSNDFTKMSEMLWIHVMPLVKQISVTPNVTTQIVDLATNFTLLSIYDSALSNKFEQNFVTQFKYFVQGDNVNIRLTRRYLCEILSDNVILMNLKTQVVNYESLIVQAFVKCSVLSYDDASNQEMKTLISFVQNFEEISNLNMVVNFNAMEANDFLFSLMSTLGQNYKNTELFQEKCQYREQCNTYFSSLAKQISPLVKTPATVELAIRVYSVVAVLFLHCVHLIYIRSKPTCLLHVLLSQLVLPPSLFMEKKPHPFVLIAMRKTWHLYIKSLTQLDYKNDPYIEKNIKDLIVYYLPYFVNKNTNNPMMDKYTSVQPLIKLLFEQDLNKRMAKHVLDVIAQNFVICRGRNVHSSSPIVLSLLYDVVQKARTDIPVMNLVISCIGYSVMEQVMLLEETTPSKRISNNILELLTKSSILKENEDLRKEMTNAVVLLSQKHLAFRSSFFFGFLHKLAELAPLIVEVTLPDIKKQICSVEVMRGVGHDAGLRNSLQRLENSLKLSKQKHSLN